jgi:hypothetical protein
METVKERGRDTMLLKIKSNGKVVLMQKKR